MNKELGIKIKTARETAGMTQDELASAVSRTTTEVALWENGKEPRPKTIIALAEATQMPIGFFINDVEDFNVKETHFTAEELESVQYVQELVFDGLQEQIGHNMKRLRYEHGYTSTELSKASGIANSHIINLENGVLSHRFSIDYCKRLAKAYGMNVEEVVDELIMPTKTDEELSYFECIDNYPIELAEKVFGHIDNIYMVNVPHVLKAVDELPERHRDVLELRYKHGKTLDEVGKLLGISRERVRQIEVKAIRGLGHPSRSKTFILREDYQELLDKCQSLEQELAIERKKNVKLEKECAKLSGRNDFAIEDRIDELNLSIRPYNCLRRAGIDTVEELSKHTIEDLSHLKNIGEKSLNEIVEKMKSEYGIVLEGGMNNEER